MRMKTYEVEEEEEKEAEEKEAEEEEDSQSLFGHVYLRLVGTKQELKGERGGGGNKNFKSQKVPV